MSASVLCLHSPMMDIWLQERQVTPWYCTVAWCKLRARDGAGRWQKHEVAGRRQKKVGYQDSVHTESAPEGVEGQ